MYLKAVLFLVSGCLAVTGLLLAHPDLQTAFLLVIAIWSFCRLYYFMFYVLEKYIDGDYRFAGIYSFLRHVLSARKRGDDTGNVLLNCGIWRHCCAYIATMHIRAQPGVRASVLEGEPRASREAKLMTQIASQTQSYEAAHKGWVVANFSEMAVLRMEGPDRHGFLQRLLTNDVSLKPGQSLHAFYLTVQGRPLVEFLLFERENETLLLTPAEQARTAYQELDKMHFGEKLKFAIDTKVQLVLSAGPQLKPNAEALKPPTALVSVPHELILTDNATQWLTDRQAEGAELVEGGLLRVLRWEAGRPVLSEMPEKTMFLEFAQESDYSETKGCYPGQEVVARTLHRGHINKKLCALRAEQQIEPGTPLQKDGQEVGAWLCGGPHPLGGYLGLGIVRRGSWDSGTALGPVTVA